MAQQQSNSGKGTSNNKHAGAPPANAAASAAADDARAKGTGGSAKGAAHRGSEQDKEDHAGATGTNVGAKPKQNGHKEWFGRFAHETARLSGKPAAFILAAGAVLVWGVTGPLFNYSDTWQLVINTSTTIVTFLMVFLIQNTQNRDTMALQVKVSELILAVRGAKNTLAAAEDLTEEELEELHKHYCHRADSMRDTLEERRASRKAKDSTQQQA